MENRIIFQSMIPNAVAAALFEDGKKKHLELAAYLEHEYLIQGKIFQLIGKVIYGRDAKGVQRVTYMTDRIRSTTADIEEIQLYFAPGRTSGSRKNSKKIFGTCRCLYKKLCGNLFPWCIIKEELPVSEMEKMI